MNRLSQPVVRFVRNAFALVVLGVTGPALNASIVATTVDGFGDVGFDTSLQLNGANPVISYFDTINADLKLATCTAGFTTYCPSWQIVTVDSLGDVGRSSSLQLNGGNPVISYYNFTNGDLKLATCTAGCATATPTWQIVTVDSVGDVGLFTSLQLNGGNPVISYYDAVNDDLKLATCTANCATATPTWQIVIVDSVGDVGQFPSLRLNGGNPIISYYDVTGVNLKLATCTANCATATPTWQIVTVDSVGSVGDYTSLQLNGGNPVISYRDSGNLDLKLATCTANCATATPTWQIVTVDSVGEVGSYTSLQLNAGNPVISYFGGNVTGDLKLASCAANCATATPTWQIVTVDNPGLSGRFNSLQLRSGNPVISFIDDTNGRLRLAALSPPAVTSVAVPAIANYTTGQNLNFTVGYGDPITVAGAPVLPLFVGTTARNAAYFSGSGSASLVFRYTVQASDNDNDGVVVGTALSLNGGSLTWAGLPAALALTGVGATTGVQVNLSSSVIPSADANGTISPDTVQRVAPGATTAFTVTPNAGYTAAVGGTCGGALAGNTFTTNPITAPCSVSASFTPNTYTVTPSAGANGSISPGPQVVAHGNTAVFSLTPSAGYSAMASGTCGGTLAGNTYTTNAITASCTVVATFTLITYTVTPSAGANGSISPSTAQTVASGATTAFTVTPNAGYAAVVGGTCGGTLVANTYTTSPIAANCSVAATFTQTTAANPAQLVNIATRSRVLTDADVMIAGFIIQGDGPQSVVVRARGPSLTQAGVPGALANPLLQLFSGQTQIGVNDNWGDAANATAIAASGFAPLDPLESAILVTLQPGAYTAIVTGVGATTGVAIVEVFKN